METTQARYEPGEEATAVGYTYAQPDESTQLTAFFVTSPMYDDMAPVELVEIGFASAESTGLHGYLTTRVWITFTVPEVPEPGLYQLIVKDREDRLFGDLIGGYVNVSQDPEYLSWLEWPLDDPLIAELSDKRVIAGPGFSVSVAGLRAGRYPPGAENFMLDPSVLNRPGVVTNPATTNSTQPLATDSTVETTRELAPAAAVVTEPKATEPTQAVPSLTPDTETANWTWRAGVVVLLLAGIGLLIRRRHVPHTETAEPVPEEPKVLVDR